jgi:hypothetical protein
MILCQLGRSRQIVDGGFPVLEWGSVCAILAASVDVRAKPGSATGGCPISFALGAGVLVDGGQPACVRHSIGLSLASQPTVKALPILSCAGFALLRISPAPGCGAGPIRETVPTPAGGQPPLGQLVAATCLRAMSIIPESVANCRGLDRLSRRARMGSRPRRPKLR